MGGSRTVLALAMLAFAVQIVTSEAPEEDPFDFDDEDSGGDIDESDSGYGQKPISKDYRGAEPGQIVFEICTS